MGIPRQDNWSALPFPPPRDLPDPGSNLYLLHLLHCRLILYHWATSEALDLLYNPEISLLHTYILMRNESLCPHKNVCANDHNNIIQNIEKVEMTQMFINWWIEKQKVLCLEHYSVIKKKWNTNTCHNMYEPWAKWKKANTKDYILHDSIYMKCP